MAKTLSELKEMVSDHYYNEAKLMNELLESNTIKEERKEKMKQKNSLKTSKKFNKHHHREEFLLYIRINEKEALCPSCNHSLRRHKIRIPHHCTEKLCNCKLSRLEAKTDYFKWFMKERRNQKTKESFLDFNDA